MPLNRYLPIFLVFLAMCGVARADSLVADNGPSFYTITQWNPALGTLNDIRVVIDASASGDLKEFVADGEVEPAIPMILSINLLAYDLFNGTNTFDIPLGSTSATTTIPSYAPAGGDPGGVGEYDTTYSVQTELDVTLDANATYETLSRCPPTVSCNVPWTYVFENTASYNFLEGLLSLTPEVDDGCGGCAAIFKNGNSTSNFEVIYDYTPNAPEPQTFVLAGIALGGMLVMAARARRRTL